MCLRQESNVYNTWKPYRMKCRAKRGTEETSMHVKGLFTLSESEHVSDVINELKAPKSNTDFLETKTIEINQICDCSVFVFALIFSLSVNRTFVRWKKGGAIVGAGQQ